MENIANTANPEWKPETEINYNPRDIRTQLYGLNKYGDLFTSRQLVALNTFCDLIQEARSKAVEDAKSNGIVDDGLGVDNGGAGNNAYGDILAIYLSAALGKAIDYNSSLCSWISGGQTMRNTFGRQALPMVWDYAEANIVGNSTGCFLSGIGQIYNVLKKLPCTKSGHVSQCDAAIQDVSRNKVVSTDPPYYDNIGYADLSDYFYIWMRRSLKSIYPEIFSTMSVPKADELVAAQYRHGSKDNAELFFLNGMTQAIKNIAETSHPAFPVSIYYAFKQSETFEGSTSSTGWETFLGAVIKAGFSIDGTWPMRTEMANRMVGSGTNALASSVVMVCKKRTDNTESVSRREFQRELREKMPEALEAMIGGETGTTPIAPVDLAQSAIGPGMAIFSKYDGILEADGSKMSVHEALILINRAITEYLNPDSGNYDNDTLFCDDWFSQYGWNTGQFGEADILARAKGTSVDGVEDAGVVESGGGKVRLLKWKEYPNDWDPKADNRTPVWEACHHMIRILSDKGESAAGALLARMPERGEAIRQLAYHLYTVCERKKWADDARAYNELIGSWHAIVSASHDTGIKDEQAGFDF
jgi:putative DNA methylase